MKCRPLTNIFEPLINEQLPVPKNRDENIVGANAVGPHGFKAFIGLNQGQPAPLAVLGWIGGGFLKDIPRFAVNHHL